MIDSRPAFERSYFALDRCLDELDVVFGFDEPIEFLHALLGFRGMPDQSAIFIVAKLPSKELPASCGGMEIEAIAGVLKR